MDDINNYPSALLALKKYNNLINILHNHNYGNITIRGNFTCFRLRYYEMYTNSNCVVLDFDILCDGITPKLSKIIFESRGGKCFNSIRKHLDLGKTFNDDLSKIELDITRGISDSINSPKIDKWMDDSIPRLNLSYFTKPPSNYVFIGKLIPATITTYNREYNIYLNKLYICWAFSELNICKDLWKMFFEIMLFGKKD